MRRRLCSHTWLVLLACALGAGAGGCGGDDEQSFPADAAATVGTQAIPESAVDGYLRATSGNVAGYGPPSFSACVSARRAADASYSEQSALRQCRIEYAIRRAQAVGMLIRAQWLDRESARRKLDTRQLLARAAHRAGVDASDRSSGADVAFRVGVLTEKLTALMPVSEAEIERYGKANANVYYGSEQRKANVLQTTTKAKAARARAELERGAAWATVQARYGVRPFDRHWTGLKTVAKRNAPEDDFGRHLFASKPRQLTGPINTLNGWFLFELIGVQRPRYPGLSPQTRQHVLTTVRAKKLDRLLQTRYAAQTECAPRYRTPEAAPCVKSAS